MKILMEKLNSIFLQKKNIFYSVVVSVIAGVLIFLASVNSDNISQRNQAIIGILIGLCILVSFKKNYRASLLIAFTLFYILYRDNLL